MTFHSEQLRRIVNEGEKIAEQYRRQVAESLLLSGIQLIPSSYLRDNQYVVSQAIYDAAKKICEEP
jgi:hypothetical protein